MQGRSDIIRKDLVLIGGGHSHVAALRAFGMRPEPGVRLTLVARDIHTAYSGMLPGYIAGHYDFDDVHVDLRPLARFAGCRLYHDEMTGLDLANHQVLCRGRPPITYDVLSIDIGSTPDSAGVPGAAEHSLPIKPVDRFLAGWDTIERHMRGAAHPFRIAVVGGGAGGVELVLSLQHRVARSGTPAQFHLFSETSGILPTHDARVRRKFTRILADRAVSLHLAHRVREVMAGSLVAIHAGSARSFPYEALIWATNAAAPAWIARTGLATTSDGFIEVDDFLQSTSHPGVFAAGDIATMCNHPRPKSGVMAVRQGPALAENLRHAARSEPLAAFIPQRRFLALISTGNRSAVASRGPLALEGPAIWRWKDRIDRRWMERYRRLPPQDRMTHVGAAPDAPADAEALRDISVLAMRCGGCGSKIGSTILARVLARIPTTARADVLVGMQDADDAAVVEIPPGRVMVHTVDFFRAIVDDPYLFGRIAANHSLSDIYAMGAQAQSALAVANVPFGPEPKMEQALYELMAGAAVALEESGAALVGGHSSEAAELAFGLCVNGLAEAGKLLRKGGMRPGDRLILGKALGTGTLFAADMRRQAKGRWIDSALESMLQSNRAAAACLMLHGAHACTDVTGFGLLGHLLEMTRPSQVDVEIDLDSLPVLDGALESLACGIFSSLQPANIRLRRAVSNLEAASAHAAYPLLFDPQTAGGLLASVSAADADSCLTALRRLGYSRSAIIGRVVAPANTAAPVTLVL